MSEAAVRIATRGSALARWQAEHAARLLRRAATAAGLELEAELVVVETTADRRLDIPIPEIGGKGVFVKEVQAALLDGRADVAVHSAKDLPSTTPDGLVLAAVPQRADPRDALVGYTLASLPRGAVVASGSLRRRAQLAALRPDLVFEGLRGNIATRLEKIPPGGAIVMAVAAIVRLGIDLAGIDHEILAPSVMVPQVGQGALAIECRSDEASLRDRLRAVEHAASRTAVDAERAFLAELGGDCGLPAGAYATVDDRTGMITLEGMLAAPDGSTVLRHVAAGTDAVAVGRAVARHLLHEEGGAALLPG
ncbi:hydroxymethylbilane synthase [Rhabdothermincola sediminis]|uniref:hydroxymethylbilane synthase n=1 Tax=Rhabdothermincola sediminis TaxID=2751370 RepID=UPI001AA051AC|nr:hydroxymethylbilane synthase [Rhabdothermincola sediminis]